MKEIVGNIFDTKVDAICITTNGVLKCNGCGVMGAGVAKEAATRFPTLPKSLGDSLKRVGNHVSVLDYISQDLTASCNCPTYTYIVSFPVKHHWHEPADLELIEQSCKELVEMVTRTGWKSVIVPQPGCGNGKLSWEQVKPICEKYFDDRFSIITKETDNGKVE